MIYIEPDWNALPTSNLGGKFIMIKYKSNWAIFSSPLRVIKVQDTLVHAVPLRADYIEPFGWTFVNAKSPHFNADSANTTFKPNEIVVVCETIEEVNMMNQFRSKSLNNINELKEMIADKLSGLNTKIFP